MRLLYFGLIAMEKSMKHSIYSEQQIIYVRFVVDGQVDCGVLRSYSPSKQHDIRIMTQE